MTHARKSKKGFTLIELMVTMAVSGIFFMLAMNLYGSANRAFLTDREYDSLYFEYNVAKAKTERYLREHPDFCKAPETKEDAPPPLWPLKCKPIDRHRSLVYFQGFLDPAQHALIAFSTVIEQ